MIEETDEERTRTAVAARLQPEDLIPDSRLQDSSLDAFGHREIAGRVADIAVYGDTPLSIALFGPWGSGKSSFFQMLRDALTEVDSTIEAIRYDAWKFGGESLKRNFVSHAATELGFTSNSPDGRPFHRGLYESVRSVDFNPGQFFKKHWKALIGAFLVAVVLCTAFVAAAAGIWSAFSNLAFGSRFAHLAPGIYKYLGTGLFAVGALINVLATVNVEQTMPSEEERFADLFRDLIVDATNRKPEQKRRTRFVNWVKFWKDDPATPSTSKIVFFIDELDRCSKEDVVATLTSLRTFLDQTKCVFVVAADRDVIEEALTAVEQSTPIREHEPYYNSASAFLDKIFQHQVSLPPLRTGRLTRFAKDLVQERGGLWADLRGADERDRLLNTVLYALVPPHVRSPRRVKVLLNNLATNIRVAESREIDWIGRATEIAKLTVLQTEFPHLASDLLLEPRLPTLLLHPPAKPTERQALLLERHRLVPAAGAEVAGATTEVEEDGVDDPDALLASGGAPSKKQIDRRIEAVRERQRMDLLRYLTSREAAGVPDPGRDLLYLEDAGKAVGLDDSDLSQLLEDYATDSPDDVRAEVQARPPQTRIAAARMLGVMSERDFGPERRNVVTVLAQAIEGLPPSEFDRQVGDLVSHVTAYAAEEIITDAQVPGLLTLAVGAGDAGQPLRTTLMADSRLHDSPEVLERVAPLLSHVTPDELVSLSSAICGVYPQHRATVLKVLADETDMTVSAFLDAGTPHLLEAINRAEKIDDDSGIVPEDGEPTATGRLILDLLEALQPRVANCNDAAVGLLAAFVADPASQLYEQTSARIAGMLPEIHDPANANQVPLAALSATPIDHWDHWAPLLQTSKDPSPRQISALTHIIGWFAADPATALDPAHVVVPAVLAAGRITEPPASIPVSIQAGIALLNYWGSDASLATWTSALKLTETIATALPTLGDELGLVIATDIERAGTGVWDASIPPRIAAAGLAAGPLGLVAAVATLGGIGATPTPTADLQPAITTSLMKVTGAAVAAGLDVTPVPMDEVLVVAAQRAETAYAAVAAWFNTNPPTDAALQVIAVTPTRGTAGAAARRWAKTLDSADATTTALAILDAGRDLFWVAVLTANDECRVDVLKGIGTRLAKPAAHADRLRLVNTVAAIKPDGFQETKLTAEMVVHLLTKDPSKLKVAEAAVLIPLLTGNYNMKRKVQAAINAADNAKRIDKRPRKAFEQTGFLTPKKGRIRQIVDDAVDMISGR